MGVKTRHKSAISITLDNKVLDFFSGKGRSGKINRILTLYLQNELGDKSDPLFHEKTPIMKMNSACHIISTQFGHESHEFIIQKALRDAIKVFE